MTLKLRVTLAVLGAFVFALLITLAALNARAETGTHIPGGGGNETVLWLNGPGEIADVRRLLQAGKSEKAIKVARRFIQFIETSREMLGSMDRTSLEYYGHNALCVALTSNGQLTEALAACDHAADLRPKAWQAYNNRGTARYLEGNYDMAMADYQKALSFTGGARDKNVEALVRHNIKLVESKLASS